MAVVEVKRQDVMRKFAITVRMSGFRSMGWRIAVSGWCFRLGAWVLGCPIEITGAPACHLKFERRGSGRADN